MTATLLTDGEGYVLRFERSLPRPPAEVWPALTTPEGLAAWFPARAEFELRVGAGMTFSFEDHDTEAPDGEVLEVAEPSVFAFAWGDGVLRFELAPDGDGSHPTFTHRFTDRGMAARQAAGWDVCLARLAGEEIEPDRMATLLARYAEELDHGRDGTVADAAEGRTRLRFERRLAHPVDRVWAALTEPDELARWLAAADVALRPGGAIVLRWRNENLEGGHTVARGTVAALEAPRVLEYELDVHGRLRWELLAEGDGCLLTLTVEGALTDEAVPMSLAGWHTHLDHLEDVLAGGAVDWSRWTEEHRPRWQEHHDRYAKRLRGAGVA